MTNTLAGTTCMELALEGERLCKVGDLSGGIRFFEEAVKVGTSDSRTLSAIYSQLGNAFFYLEDYEKALKFHTQDVDLVRSIGDLEAEAKACGNLGNTLKMLDRFDEAANYCRRSQEISRSFNDLDGQARALYNLGNVYHTKGKRIISASGDDFGDLSDDIKACLEQAVKYYEQNLELVSQLNDYSSMGRAFGNLGNTHYLLGNFELAVENHTKRLELAKKTNEKSAQRRAYLNLGNANVFLGNFQLAVECYTETLELAQELHDKFTEAHSCYSLANTYTFLHDYESAIKYHLLYLDTIANLDDKLGEGRACWSLVNIYQMVNNPELALTFAKRHFKIACELGDKVGEESARLNIEELNSIIEQKQAAKQATMSSADNQFSAQRNNSSDSNATHSPTSKHIVTKKHNADRLYTYRLTPDKRQDQELRRFKKQLNKDFDSNLGVAKSLISGKQRLPKSGSSEKLFDMIAHFQRGRIDDQRCEMFSRTTPTLSATQPKTAYNCNNDHLDANSKKGKENLAANCDYSSASNNNSNCKVKEQSKLQQSSNNTQQQPAKAPCKTLETTTNKRAFRTERIFSTGNAIISQTIPECKQLYPQREKSHSIAPPSLLLNPASLDHQQKPQAQDNQQSSRLKSKSSSSETSVKFRPLPSVISSDKARSSHAFKDENFLDSLMKYQSSRFDDQRSEFPKPGPDKTRRVSSAARLADTKVEKDDFFNLIVKFQSDRIDDQRSALPTKIAPKLIHQSSTNH